MANNDDGSGKKRDNKKIIGIVSGCTLAVGNGILCLFNKGITPIQMINFINSWPVVILGVCFCLTLIMIERHWQDNETKRNKFNKKIDQKQIDEYKEKANKLEKDLDEEKKKNMELSIKYTEAEMEIKYLEREIERLKEKNKEGERGTERRFLVGGRGGT